MSFLLSEKNNKHVQYGTVGQRNTISILRQNIQLYMYTYIRMHGHTYQQVPLQTKD